MTVGGGSESLLVSLGIEIDKELIEQMARLSELHVHTARGDAVQSLRVSSRTTLPVLMLLLTDTTTNLALATYH